MKIDSYQVVTDRIVQQLEKGLVPWRKPWRATDSPKNLITLKNYRGINVFLLNAMMFESPYFLTCKQAEQLGGNVKRGEKASPVVFWKWFQVTDAESPKGIKTGTVSQILFSFQPVTVRKHSGNQNSRSRFEQERRTANRGSGASGRQNATKTDNSRGRGTRLLSPKR